MEYCFKNLNKIEFVVTDSCTGKCRHCSQGDHSMKGSSIDGRTAAAFVTDVCREFDINTVMTFGGEPLLFPESVFLIHSAATRAGVLHRQLITNGYFSKRYDYIRKIAYGIRRCGINDVLLSADAFHQEYIPIDYPLFLSKCLLDLDVSVKCQPAWLVGSDADNSYNRTTREILYEFEKIGVMQNSGNIIFRSGNAAKYLSEFFDDDSPDDPYAESSDDIRTLSVDSYGNVLGGNIYNDSVLDITNGRRL